MRSGSIYTETVIYSAPAAFTKDVPYQTAIVTLDGGGRVSGRIAGERVAIDDRVVEVATGETGADAHMAGVPFFRKAELK